MQITDQAKAREMIQSLSRNFSVKEFSCKCPCGRSLMDDELVKSLQKLRLRYGQPIYLTSAYRCEMHNIKVGGAPRSLHKKGMAVDIDLSKMGGSDLIRLIRLSQDPVEGFRMFNGLGLGDNKLHLDIRSDPVAWSY